MFEKYEVCSSSKLIDKLNLECNFESVYLILRNFSVNTIVKIVDDVCEDLTYYNGSVLNYLELLNDSNNSSNYTNYYVMNCLIEDNILILRVLINS